MVAGGAGSGRTPANRRGSVHLPDPNAGTVVLLPQNVRPAIIVEITGIDDMPASAAGPGRTPANLRGSVHLPDPDAGTVVLLPQNVRPAIIVEIVLDRDRAGDGWRRRDIVVEDGRGGGADADGRARRAGEHHVEGLVRLD